MTHNQEIARSNRAPATRQAYIGSQSQDLEADMGKNPTDRKLIPGYTRVAHPRNSTERKMNSLVDSSIAFMKTLKDKDPDKDSRVD